MARIPVLLLTAHATVPLAVEAMRAGAADFLVKPFDREELTFVIRKALRGAETSARPEITSDTSAPTSPSAAMVTLHERIRKAAASHSTVLIRGESGTGKERAARALHASSPRADRPFVAVHCAALPDALLESELFGYEKGAFTGALRQKPGRVDLAEGGTLFLDEIGDLSPATQVKLLRLLQEKTFERLGGGQTLTANVRFIAATHRPLEQLIKEGTFREDLFYRLNVVPIWIPALRERTEDIATLAIELCAALARDQGKPSLGFHPAALELLRAQAWPGNVRQLQNFVERLVIFSDGEHIERSDVERELARVQSELSVPGNSVVDSSLGDQRREAERRALQNALERARGNRTLAARLLGVSRRTLYNKLDEHELG